jgi:hypothetical protein
VSFKDFWNHIQSNATLCLIGILFIAVGCICYQQNFVNLTSNSLLISLILFLLIGRFKKVTGWGFKAEMWEQKQEEAEYLINALSKQLKTSSFHTIKMATQLGTWGGHYYKPKELFALYEGTLDN